MIDAISGVPLAVIILRLVSLSVGESHTDRAKIEGLRRLRHYSVYRFG